MSPEVAKDDTYGFLNTGDAEVRVQIKAGDPIPAGVRLEKGTKTEGKPSKAQAQAAAKDEGGEK